MSRRGQALAAVDGAGFAIHAAAAAAAARGEDAIVLSLGDTDLDTPPPIRAAAKAALDAGRTHYAPAAGHPALRAAIAEDRRRTDGLARRADDVVVFQGAQSALAAAILAVTDPGDDVMVLEPRYVTYPHVAALAGVGLVAVPFRRTADGRPRPVTRAVLEAHATERLAAILVNSPGNPTGHMLSAEEAAAIAAFASARGLWIVSDEVYRTLVFDAAARSPALAPGAAARTVVVDSLSKSHAMTGWRIGWTLSPPALTPALLAIKMAALFNSPTFVEDAALVAVRDCAGASGAIAAELGARRDLMVAALRPLPGLGFESPPSGMFIWLDVSGLGLDGEAFADALYRSERVSVVPGRAFGASGAAHVRVSFSAARRTLAEGAARIARFVSERAGAATAGRRE
jgi:arginine:pyruvate transaminase